MLEFNWIVGHQEIGRLLGGAENHLHTHTGIGTETRGKGAGHKLQKNDIPWRFSSVQFSHSVMFDSLQFHGLQHTRPPCPSPTPGVHSNSCPLSWWCQPTVSSLLSLSPTFNLSQHQGLFQWVSSLHQVAKILEFQLQHQSFQWTPRTDLF